MIAARTRFLRRSLLVLLGSVVAAGSIAATVSLLLHTPDSDAGFGPLVAFIAVVLLLMGLGGGAIWNGIGLMRIARLKPDALVFLARREPTLTPDLPVYLHRKDISADVSDRWVPAVIDERGLAAWTGGFRPREILIMEWSELGKVEAADYISIDGQRRFGISVDVAPFPTPLIVRVGTSMFGLQAAFDREGTLAVADDTNALRPAPAP
ncbi:MAG: hypothetical protein KF761_11785 [Salinibacterium sp.]|nr:hypothetical protein [Salinibacterium sp.]